MNTYGTPTTTLVKGEGALLWDSQGKQYLDALSGIAVCGLGYNHPRVTEAIVEQSKALIHVSNLYRIEAQVELAKALIEISGMDNVFFSNSGAEANEAAIKISRKYANSKGITQPEIICAHSSFHGRTMATLSATGNSKIQDGFAPLVSGFKHADYNSIDSILAAATDNTVAVMVEPVQGEGGVNVPDHSYLPQLRELCTQKGWLLILDEIQTGNGRTGKYFAYQHYDFIPDVVTTAKGLANGVPIGACLASGPAAQVFQPGNHGSTFGGNPLACSAALAVVKTITSEKLDQRAAELGDYFLSEFGKRLQDLDSVVNIRGKGLMIGIELNKECSSMVTLAKDKGILLNVTAGKTIRLLPPLILNKEQADLIINTIHDLIVSFQ